MYNSATELNGTTGLYDLAFRNYDPVLGRFAQVDPLADKFGSMTPYNYANNDPVYFNDPMGLAPVQRGSIADETRNAGCSWCSPGEGGRDNTGGEYGMLFEMNQNWYASTHRFRYISEGIDDTDKEGGHFVEGGNGQIKYPEEERKRLAALARNGDFGALNEYANRYGEYVGDVDQFIKSYKSIGSMGGVNVIALLMLGNDLSKISMKFTMAVHLQTGPGNPIKWFGTWEDISSPDYPGIKIYETSLAIGAITLPGIGILVYPGGGKDKALLQHEYGHYLDYKFSGDLNFHPKSPSSALNFYMMIGIPSLLNTIPFVNELPGLDGSHRNYWTEIRANQWAESWFGDNLAPDFKNRFPTKSRN